MTPRFRWDGHAWAGSIELPSWKGFQTRNGPYGSRSRPTKTAKVRLQISPLDGHDEAQPPARPSVEQLAAYDYVLRDDATLQKSLLARILKQYPKLRAAYHADFDIVLDKKGRQDDEEDEDLFDDMKPLPEIKRPTDLRAVLGLANVHILNVAKGGIAYVGFELGCDWDEEHGAGVMFHEQRIVELGQADSSFLAWIAERDGGVRIGDKPPVRKQARGR